MWIVKSDYDFGLSDKKMVHMVTSKTSPEILLYKGVKNYSSLDCTVQIHATMYKCDNGVHSSSTIFHHARCLKTTVWYHMYVQWHKFELYVPNLSISASLHIISAPEIFYTNIIRWAIKVRRISCQVSTWWTTRSLPYDRIL